jgi:hypothetical protein
MPSPGTLLDSQGRRDFGASLLERAEKRISAARTADERRQIRGSLCDALCQPSISRLRDYARGVHFPMPGTVRALARPLVNDRLLLLVEAGYHREVIPALHALEVAGRSPKWAGYAERSIEYAVRLFPRRGERYREGQEPWRYGGALLGALLSSASDLVELDRATEAADQRVTLDRDLSRAYDILGEGALEADCRRAIAGELVRSWAVSVHAAFTQSIEASTYVTSPRVGERAIPILSISSVVIDR